MSWWNKDKENELLKSDNIILVEKIEALEAELGKEKTDLNRTIERLEKEKKTLKEDISDLKLKKKHEEEDIKHMVKIKEEKNAIEQDKKSLELERKKDTEIATIRTEYAKKVEENLEKQIDEMKDMCGKVMALVPDVNVKLKGNLTS